MTRVIFDLLLFITRLAAQVPKSLFNPSRIDRILRLAADTKRE
jgi:hypothetical protein